MDANATWEPIAALVLLAAFILMPKRLAARTRAIGGSSLFIIGWAGVFIGLALGEETFMQDENIVSAWVGACGLSILIGIVLLVELASEWWLKSRRDRRTKERWRAGHWRD